MGLETRVRRYGDRDENSPPCKDSLFYETFCIKCV